ncbi:gamma-glutamylcyclotransferase [Bdellovibrio sp. NC01]|uniref:gamma-glutamylcyclotransferase n=1 Tax=Bdellovibrio sp. NC01 TaxID=2220073 RepID=UPI00115A59F8|nr:gamma-glutamylcyclotransferase [Bdellovibrio sp. NC01]QDK37210.1 gamma-glutamylcyclotransferase [Bdellovibrio sp. NC01]
MDAHYGKVMQARDQIKTDGSKLYFAYSGVLDRQAFEIWAEEHSYQFFTLPEGQVAEAKGVDLIFDFPSRWWGGRVAGLTEKEGASVFGRLFAIPEKEWPIIQHKEGVVTGMSVETTLRVLVDGQEFEATAFVTSPNRRSLDGPVSERYLEALVRGARASGLPEEYIASLPAKAQ